MNILTPENYSFDVDQVTDTVPDEMFCVLDLSSVQDADYYFKYILNTVAFNSISVDLQIGTDIIQVPLLWQILLGDEETGMMEMCTVENLLNTKNPHAFVYNPISSLYPKYEPVKVLRVYILTVKWQIPMVPKKNLLAVPLRTGHKPPCVFLADENEKIPDLFLGN